jgi:hypothetical protein
MLSRTLRRALRRTTRRAAIVALAALGLIAALAPAAPAAVRSNFSVALLGTHDFGAFGVYDITGNVAITTMDIPGDPCRHIIPVDPCRKITITTIATGLQGPIACGFSGTSTFSVPRADTATVDATVPGNPLVPPNPVCPQLGALTVRYTTAFDVGGRITSAVAQTDPVT